MRQLILPVNENDYTITSSRNVLAFACDSFLERDFTWQQVYFKPPFCYVTGGCCAIVELYQDYDREPSR